MRKKSKKNLYKILITWRLLVDSINKYSSILKKYKIRYDTVSCKQHMSEKKLLKIIHKYDGIICGDDELTQKVLSRAKKLKIISKWGTGIDSIDKNYAKEKNISIYNTPGAFTTSVAQHGVALMFAILRNIVFNHIDILEKNWSKRTCYTVESKKIGIIGFGKIGREIYRILSIFQPKIYINDIKKIEKTNTPLNILLKKSDIIFLCCDLNKSSKHLIKYNEIKKMKKEAILINIARGALINNKDLYKALHKKIISSAGLDVFENEPLEKNSKFLKLKNCIMTSHNAFNSKELIKDINIKSINNLINFFRR